MSNQPEKRYSRQAVLKVIGKKGQRKLSESTVLIVGCGALGSVQAELLARAGIGRLIIVDRDFAEESNLQRQILFDEKDVSEKLPKALAAARRLKAINSQIAIEAKTADLTAKNIEELFRHVDLILDGTDNFETRYLINDAAVKVNKPWVYGGVLETSGSVMAIRPGQGPCLQCIFEKQPNASQLPTCETHGVLNTAVAWIAALQVTEALKVLLEEPANECKFYSLDIWQGTIKSLLVKVQEDCICCGQHRFEFLSAQGSTATVLCGRNAVQITVESSFLSDLESLRQTLLPWGAVSLNGQVLEFIIDDEKAADSQIDARARDQNRAKLDSSSQRMLIIPDGRVLVMKTTDIAEARSVVAKYLGVR